MSKPPFRRGNSVSNGENRYIVNRVYKRGEEWWMLVGDTLWDYERAIVAFCVERRCSDFYSINEPVVPSKLLKKLKSIKMSNNAIAVGVTLAIVVFIGMWFVGNYNSLVQAKAEVDKSWAFVETQYQRRFDLIDNLVASVKGAQKQEIEVFGKIAESRSKIMSAGSVGEKVSATNELETNIALLPRLQEAYPELKSNQTVQYLMNELTGTETGIAASRDRFNVTATNYNVNVTRFPKNLFAKTFGFSSVELFKSVTGADKGVKVQF